MRYLNADGMTPTNFWWCMRFERCAALLSVWTLLHQCMYALFTPTFVFTNTHGPSYTNAGVEHDKAGASPRAIACHEKAVALLSRALGTGHIRSKQARASLKRSRTRSENARENGEGTSPNTSGDSGGGDDVGDLPNIARQAHRSLGDTRNAQLSTSSYAGFEDG
jgi:hypothetical protein